MHVVVTSQCLSAILYQNVLLFVYLIIVILIHIHLIKGQSNNLPSLKICKFGQIVHYSMFGLDTTIDPIALDDI